MLRKAVQKMVELEVREADQNTVDFYLCTVLPFSFFSVQGDILLLATGIHTSLMEPLCHLFKGSKPGIDSWSGQGDESSLFLTQSHHMQVLQCPVCLCVCSTHLTSVCMLESTDKRGPSS